MPNWKHSVDIKKVLNNDDLSLQEKAVQVSALLKSIPVPMHPFLEVGLRVIEEAGQIDDVELFDDGLVYIYDWGDELKIWLGM